MFEARGLIRKISINDIKNGITYVVGQPMLGGRFTITEIRLDVDGSTIRGVAKYDILVAKTGSETSRMWKSVEGMPVSVEYELEPEADVDA